LGILKGPFDLEAFKLLISCSISLVITGNNTKLFLRGVVIYLSILELALGILAASSGPTDAK
jgi:hypothetical protein